MKRFRQRKNGGEWRIEKQTVLEMLFLTSGIFSILLVVRSLPHILFSEWAVFAAVILVCGGMYRITAVRRSRGLLAGGVILAACGIAAAVRSDLFVRQTAAVRESLTDMGAQNGTDVTYTLFIAAAGLSVCFFVIENIWKQHWIPYIAVTGVLAGAPLFGIQTGLVPVLLGLAFQILFWTMRAAESQAHNSRRGEKGKEGKGKASLPVRCTVFTGKVLCVLACFSTVIVSVWGNGLSDLVYSGEGFVSRSMQQITGRAETPAANGYVSSGNNYRTGREQAEVTLLEQPEETLYLKGFTGGEYTGGEWQAADEREVFHEIAVELHWESWESWIGGMFSSMYFVMNEASAENGNEPRRIYISHADESYQTMYTPYFSGWFNRNDVQVPGYAYQYYEEGEMDVDWDNVPEDFTRIRDWLRDIADAYVEVMPDAYTSVPEKLLPRLTELCRSGEAGSLEEATAFILSTLRSGAAYTLTPGRAPLNEDIVEYFLFENHEGYCVHFASAATLMYRLFGYPSRYASGYALQPSDFVQQEDGTWRAQVTDEAAHAWTEIFLEDYGWTPVEVTPASDGSFSTSYPGLDTGALEGILAEMELDLNVSGTGVRDADRAANPAEEGSRGESEGVFDSVLQRYHDLIVAGASVLAESLLLLPLFLDYRKLRRHSREERMGCRGIFARLLKLLHAKRHMSGYNGTEEDFPEKLAETLPCISRDEAEKLSRIVSRAAYGCGDVSEEENEFVRKIYFRAEEWIKTGGGRRKRRK